MDLSAIVALCCLKGKVCNEKIIFSAICCDGSNTLTIVNTEDCTEKIENKFPCHLFHIQALERVDEHCDKNNAFH